MTVDPATAAAVPAATATATAVTDDGCGPPAGFSLGLPGAVAGNPPDAGVAWHYGDPLREQRLADTVGAVVDRSHRQVLAVSGPDRLTWLHSMTTQRLDSLAPMQGTETLLLSPQGHVEHDMLVADDGHTAWLDVEPGTGDALRAFLERMRFMLRVEVSDVTAAWAVLSVVGPGSPWPAQQAVTALPDQHAGQAVSGAPVQYYDVARHAGGLVRRMPYGADLLVPREAAAQVAGELTATGLAMAGLGAFEALRVVAGRPRAGFETDHRTIPHEIGFIGGAVHLNKGCYRGQETVARVHNLGKPPRQLVLLHLSGESDELPEPGTPIELNGRAVGFLGTAVHHHELGPVALAVIKRTLAENPGAAGLTVAGAPVSVD
jgi:folate-binding protein YgfZ